MPGALLAPESPVLTGVAVDRRPDYHSIMKKHDNHPLSAQYSALFGLLKETEPIAETYDVEWWGPYFIPRARQWHRSRFLLYRGRIFGSIQAGWTTYSSTWDISSGSREGLPGSSIGDYRGRVEALSDRGRDIP